MAATDAAEWPAELELAPSPTFDPHPPLSEAGRKAITDFVRTYNAMLEKAQRSERGPWLSDKPLLGEPEADYLSEAVVSLDFRSEDILSPIPFGLDGINLQPALRAAAVQLDPIQLVRLLALCHEIALRGGGLSWVACEVLEAYRSQCRPNLSLRDLSVLFETVGLDSSLIAQQYLDAWQPCLRWGPEATWPYFAQRTELLAAALDGRRQKSLLFNASRAEHDGAKQTELLIERSEPSCIGNALDALSCFPRVPPPLRARLWALATGSAKTFRAKAQRVLQKEPDAFDRVTQTLSDKRFATRAVAAAWLGEWGDERATPALQQALRKEKHDQARDAIMTALEALGLPLDGILDPRDIEAAAIKSLSKKGLPGTLAWLPFETLPTLRWHRSGKAVPRETLVWWCIQADKLKSPEPGALLRRQIRLVHPADREPLGLAILQAWIDFDTMPGTMEQARASAQRQRDRWLEICKWDPEFQDEIPPLDVFVEQALQQPMGSAIRQKGLLAIPAACGGESVTRLACDFIRTWYGLRAAQSKALVWALSWMETKSAVQFLTATAKSFRTRGVQAEAQKALQSLADRRGWTVDELADRMVPDAGLDSDGRLSLDFGARSFVAELDPGMRLQVRNEAGERLKDLPKPGKTDDEAQAAEARQCFSRAKKQIRTVVKEQTARLFGAMCVGREWRAEDWQANLARHPIVGRLCERLVWLARAGEEKATLRPRFPNGPVDAAGQSVQLPPDARIVVAHDVNTPPELAVPWMVHFEDRAIEPLFPQFNRGLPDPAELSLDSQSINDFEGREIGALALGGIARKLGYHRGEGRDGPTFYDYRKSYPSLALEVHVEFSGQDFQAEDQTVTLQRMTFRDLEASRYLELRDLPPILLLESYRDLREIASKGR